MMTAGFGMVALAGVGVLGCNSAGGDMAILDVMNEAIDRPDEMSPHAPRVITVKVPVDKIGEVIGPKGKMINQIQDDTGAEISIEDDGTVYIGATEGLVALVVNFLSLANGTGLASQRQ